MSVTFSSPAVSANELAFSQLNPSNYTPTVSQFTLTTVGTGAGGALGANGFTLTTPPSAIGSSLRRLATYTVGSATNGNINWAKPVGFSAKFISFYRYSDIATARVSFGTAGGAVGSPTVRSIGFYQTASAPTVFNPLVLEVHNGTTLTTVTSSFTPTLNNTYEVVCYSDGNGNVTLYVNGASVATTSAGATTKNTITTAAENVFQFEISQTVAPTAYESYFVVQQPKFLST
jgi:hypothetical protein